ncbi:hypothetical protein [Moraxella catarrhalis]|uniref:hypothetical protein n=1 Tax=Moraxella catarrhalis TaxID=480 RepID=UPI0018847BED|nr:hypothetical protein [Moraxella catarrhalis]
MIIKGYKIDWTFAMLAMSFVMAAIVSNNFAFMGGVIICLIFGIKKIKKTILIIKTMEQMAMINQELKSDLQP